MSMRFTQLQCKEVICVSDGRRLGFVTDVQVEIPSGNVCAIVVPCPARFPGRLRAAGRFYHSLELHQAHRPGHRAGGGEARRLPGAERKAGAAKIAQPRRNSFPRAGIFLRFLGNNACNYAFHPI